MRRLLIVGLLLSCLPLSAQEHPSRPHAVVQPVGRTDARWTKGFWSERFETIRNNTVPSMGDLMEGTTKSHFLQNFKIAAGQEQGSHRGPPWNDGDFYKWIEAAAAVLAVTRDEALERRLESAIACIAAAQRKDGYLHTPVLIKNRNGDSSAKPFADRLNFEMYNFGHLFTAGVVYYQATGKKTLLQVAVRAADYLCEVFKKPTPELARNSVCPAHYMGILDLYRVTGEKRYLQLAQQWLAMRDLVTDGTDDNQDRLPFRKQTEAVGHAVRANYLYAGVADLVAETGDATLMPPLEALWESVALRKMYLTGACGAVFDGASPEGSKDQKSITKTHQAYGHNFQLPNSTAHNETCAAVGNFLWNQRMSALTGEAGFADVMERVLYNALLAGISLDGKKFFYTNTLRQLDKLPIDLRWSRTREPWISCYCCPPNTARILAQVHTYAYGVSAKTVWVHLFGSSILETTLPEGGKVRLEQETDYPWDGKIRITIQEAPNQETALRLRIPSWAAGAALQLNKKPLEAKVTPGSYQELRRTWKSGDVVELDLPLRVRLTQSHPLVEETRNQLAVERGPLVYCLESLDLPESLKVLDIQLARDTDWKTTWEPKTLGGVVSLEGNVYVTREPPWGKELYREWGKDDAKPVQVRMIPYYTWGNRGSSEMSVWLGRLQ